MAQKGQKDLFARLADAGEEALSRLASTPGADRVLAAMTNMRDQLDALAARVRGMDALERRIEELERQIEELRKSRRPSTSSSAGTRKRSTSSTAPKSSTARKSGTTSRSNSSSGSTKKTS